MGHWYKSRFLDGTTGSDSFTIVCILITIESEFTY